MSVEDHAVQIAVVDDYDVVVAGVANMLEPYRDRVVVAELDTGRPVKDEVDIALYDSFAQPESDQQEIKVLVDNPRARRVVVYTWNFHPDLVSKARDLGVSGYLSKALTARELVGALEAVHAGEVVVSESPTRSRTLGSQDWPGRREGLTDREAEILALITQGKSNAEVAALTYLSPNTIKSYIRTLYRKIDVTSRTQAVLWGVDNGFLPDHHRIEHWRGRPLGRRVDLLAALGRRLGAVRVGGRADVVGAPRPVGGDGRQHDGQSPDRGQDVAHHREVDAVDRVADREGQDQSEGQQEDAESVSHGLSDPGRGPG